MYNMRVYACMDAWMHGCMDAWMHGCMDAWMHGCMLCNLKCDVSYSLKYSITGLMFTNYGI